MPEFPIWITEAEVVSFVDLGDAISEVRNGLLESASGVASSMGKAQMSLDGAALHVTGAVSARQGFATAKAWTHTKTGATPILLLWSAEDGRLLAVIEAFALGQYRTAAVSAVAADLMAADGATELAVCGTGKQALMQVAAVNAVRDIRTVHIWSPKAASRQRFAASVQHALGIETREAESAEAATRGADIVILVTRSTSPFLSANFVKSGAHVNAVGAVGPERAEFDGDLLGRCQVIAVDDLQGARAWSREFGQYFGDSDEAWQAVSELSELVAKAYQRPAEADVTLFKAMGLGLADLSVARLVYERAIANGLGTPLSNPERSHPRLRSALKGGPVK